MRSGFTLVATLLALLALTGCPTGNQSQAQTLTYLTTPYFQVVLNNPVCQQLYAVDGNGQGWQAMMCGTQTSGLIATQLLTAAQLASVSTAFAALPATQDPNCVDDDSTGSTVTTLTHGTAGDAGIESWIACVATGGAALTQPYATAVATLEDLVQTPVVQDP